MSDKSKKRRPMRGTIERDETMQGKKNEPEEGGLRVRKEGDSRHMFGD